MTEGEYRALEAAGQPFACGGVEYDLLPPEPEVEPCC